MSEAEAEATDALQHSAGRPLVRTALWLILGGWFGSYLLFGAIIAPTAFSVLPSTEIAGTLIGPVLTKLHLYGALAGIPLALLSRSLGRSGLLAAGAGAARPAIVVTAAATAHQKPEGPVQLSLF